MTGPCVHMQAAKGEDSGQVKQQRQRRQLQAAAAPSTSAFTQADATASQAAFHEEGSDDVAEEEEGPQLHDDLGGGSDDDVPFNEGGFEGQGFDGAADFEQQPPLLWAADGLDAHQVGSPSIIAVPHVALH